MIVAGVNSGEVGIWWYTDEGEVWKQSCLIDSAYSDGVYLQYSDTRNHQTDWLKTIKENTEDKSAIFQLRKEGYKTYERGRVIFDLRTQSYLVTCSDQLVNDLSFKIRLIEAFNIPKGRVDFTSLSHYYKYTGGENPELDAFEGI